MEKVSLQIPNKAEYLSSLRLLVSGLLTNHSVDIETMEDLKIAITEGCNIALELNCKDEIDIEFIFDEGNLKIEIGHICEKDINEREELYLSTTIIDCLVDSSHIEKMNMKVIFLYLMKYFLKNMQEEE